MNSEVQEEYDDFTIRIRFRLPAHKLGIEESEVVAGTASNGNDVLLKSVDLESPIKDAEWLILVSQGWESEDAAKTESPILVDNLCRSLAYNNLGADLGRRTPGGGFFRAFLDDLEKKSDRPILNDERGPMIYATRSNPRVARIGDINPYLSISKDNWVASFQNALKLRHSFTEKEKMAFDLYSMAHKSSQSADARFVLLFAAIETLIEPSARSKKSQEHVNKMIDLTKRSDLPKAEVNSLVGTLRWMLGHSIRTGGRLFVKERLGETMYGELSAEEFFLKSYDLRNKLMHGQQPFADWREVSNITAPLEKMVSHLLSGELRSDV